MFEAAVNRARNDTSLHSASHLLDAFQELHTGSKYPPVSKRMRSVTTLRKALLLFLALVIKSLPYGTASFATCRRPDGSYAVSSFDGLQLGYRVKYKIAFDCTDVKIRPVTRPSLVLCMTANEAVLRAIGCVLSAQRDVKGTASTKAIKTITAMRGHVIAVALLLGNITVDGVKKNFDGDKTHLEGGTTTRGWDPAGNGGAAPSLVALFRKIFDWRVAARSLALAIESVPDDLSHRVPGALMNRVHAVVADIAPPCGTSASVVTADYAVAGASVGDDDLRNADTKRGRKRYSRTAAASSSSSSSEEGRSGGTDATVSEDDDGFYMPRAAQKPSDAVWEREVPLLSNREALGEPALASTGGGCGAGRLQTWSLPLQPHVPSTAASALKLMPLMRAIVADATLEWAPQVSQEAVDALVVVLRSKDFTIAALGAVLRFPAVTEQRRPRSAVRCWGPGMEADPRVRELLADVLGLKERVDE